MWSLDIIKTLSPRPYPPRPRLAIGKFGNFPSRLVLHYIIAQSVPDYVFDIADTIIQNAILSAATRLVQSVIAVRARSVHCMCYQNMERKMKPGGQRYRQRPAEKEKSVLSCHRKVFKNNSYLSSLLHMMTWRAEKRQVSGVRQVLCHARCCELAKVK